MADACEHDAANADRIVEVRQFRLLAQAWRDTAAEIETALAEARSCHPARAGGRPEPAAPPR